LLKLIPLLFALAIFQGCAPATKVSCGDLFSEYAEKPAKLEYLECNKGTGQTVFEAKYRVSDEAASDVEQELVKRYGFMKYSDYYHAMPQNLKYIESKKLLERNPDYSLSIHIIEIDYETLELELHRGGDLSKKRRSFLVNVKVMLI